MTLRRTNVASAFIMVLFTMLCFIPWARKIISSYKGYDGWALLSLPLIFSFVFFMLSSLTVFIISSFPLLARGIFIFFLTLTALVTLISLMYGYALMILISVSLLSCLLLFILRKLPHEKALLVNNTIGITSMTYWAFQFQ